MFNTLVHIVIFLGVWARYNIIIEPNSENVKDIHCLPQPIVVEKQFYNLISFKLPGENGAISTGLCITKIISPQSCTDGDGGYLLKYNRAILHITPLLEYDIVDLSQRCHKFVSNE